LARVTYKIWGAKKKKDSGMKKKSGGKGRARKMLKRAKRASKGCGKTKKDKVPHKNEGGGAGPVAGRVGRITSAKGR